MDRAHRLQVIGVVLILLMSGGYIASSSGILCDGEYRSQIDLLDEQIDLQTEKTALQRQL